MDGDGRLRCFVAFYPCHSLRRALARAKALAKELSEIEIVGWVKREAKLPRIVMRVPDYLIKAVSRGPGVSVFITEDDNCPSSDRWIRRLVGPIIWLPQSK